MKFVACTLLAFLFCWTALGFGERLREVPGHASTPVISSFESTQLLFEKNLGQGERDAQFIAHGAGYDVVLERSGLVFSVRDGAATERIGLEFAGTHGPMKMSGEDRQPTLRNYYLGSDPAQWHWGIPTFGRVRYRGIYPGIDLVLYSRSGHLEFDLIASPHANPGQIRFSIHGPHRLMADGDILLGSDGQVRIQKPHAYQTIGWREKDVSASFVVSGDGVSLALAGYKSSAALTVDPVVLFQGYVSAGLANPNYLQPIGVAADASSNVYTLALKYFSTVSRTAGPCAINKFNAAGTQLYQTFFGPTDSQDFSCNAIAVDAQGNTYISGLITATASQGIPTTSGVVQPTPPGGQDAFAAKLGPAGQLSYGTYLGGSGQDSGSGIAVDSSGNVYITGLTYSNDFPVVNPFQSSFTGSADAFVSALNPTASAFIYSTYLGGSNSNQGHGIAVDASGDAYVSGETTSADFPLQNPLVPSCGAPCDTGFLTKFSPSGSSLAYSTYLPVISFPVAVDANGNAFIGGRSNQNSVPLLLSINPSGSAYNFSMVVSALQGYFVDVDGVGLDASGNVYAAGDGCINPLDPLEGCVPFLTGGFVASYTNSGTPIYATDIEANPAVGVAGGGSGNAAIIGQYGSAGFSDGGLFSVNLYQAPSFTYVSLISAHDAPALGVRPVPLAFGYQQVGTPSPSQDLNLINPGSATLDLNSIVVSGPFTQTNSTCGATLGPVGQTCALSIVFTPTNTNPAVGAVTITDNSLGSPHAIQLTGQGAAPGVTLNPTSLSFPNTPVGQSSAPEPVTLTNSGHASLNISRIGISGDFSETNTCGTTVPAGQNCTISVTFTPTATGTRNGSVTIADDAAGSPQTVPLSGTSVPDFAIGPAAGSPSSATITAGQTASFNLAITPSGSFSGTVNLTCAVTPVVTPAPVCKVPASVSVTAGTVASATATVSTTAPMTAGAMASANFPSGGSFAG